MAFFIVISALLLVVTAHTPEEWRNIFNSINE